MSFIFLSYAKEDKHYVVNIYKSLKDAGLNPWMDAPPSPYETEGIPPGKDWDQVLRNRIKEARIALAFLSKQSVAKQGYIQREYRLALNEMMEKAPGEIFLIPVLLESCKPPDIRVDSISLNQLQWYKMYEKGLDNLVSQLKQIFTKDSIQEDLEQNLENISLRNQVNYLSWKTTDIMNVKDKTIIKLEREIDSLRKEIREKQGEQETDRMFEKFNKHNELF